MAQNVYEGMFLLDPIKYAHDPVGTSALVEKRIQGVGGEILVSRLWDERRLAYPIKGHRKGVYWLTYFRLEGTKLAELRHQCQLDSTILRVLFLRIDPRIVATLVEHARSGQPAWRKAEPAEAMAEVAAPDEIGESFDEEADLQLPVEELG